MSHKEKIAKTNAVRMVEDAGVPYQIHTYDAAKGFKDGVTVAHETGIPVERCFKTLVLGNGHGGYFVCVIPVAEELDLKKAARSFGEKKIDMIHVREITPVTGYIKGGCSPIGMKKLFPTRIDETAVLFETIAVSAGKIGMQIEAGPEEIRALCDAEYADLTR